MFSVELLKKKKKTWKAVKQNSLYYYGLARQSRFSLAVNESSVVQQARKIENHNDKVLDKWDVCFLTNSFWQAH